MSAAEAYVIVPFQRWKAMSDHHVQKPTSSQELMPPPTSSSSDPIEHNPEASKPSSDKSAEFPIGKDLTKPYTAAHILKQVEFLRSLHNDAIDRFGNLESLVKSAMSNSRKELPNEAEFYDFLIQNNLASFVRNRNKIAKYFKKPWYLI